MKFLFFLFALFILSCSVLNLDERFEKERRKYIYGDRIPVHEFIRGDKSFWGVEYEDENSDS